MFPSCSVVRDLIYWSLGKVQNSRNAAPWFLCVVAGFGAASQGSDRVCAKWHRSLPRTGYTGLLPSVSNAVNSVPRKLLRSLPQ